MKYRIDYSNMILDYNRFPHRVHVYDDSALYLAHTGAAQIHEKEDAYSNHNQDGHIHHPAGTQCPDHSHKSNQTHLIHVSI